MKKIVIFLFGIFIISNMAYALDPVEKQRGTDDANMVRGQLGSRSAINSFLYDPTVNTTTPYRSLDGSKTGQAPVFCSQSGAQVSQEVELIRVTMTSTGSITVATALVGSTSINSTSSFSAEKICIDGYQAGTNYYKWVVDGNGSVSSTGAGVLNGCASPESMPATYVGGHIAKMYSEATGRKITKSNLETFIARYYGGVILDCQGGNVTPEQTKYHGNPYMLESDAQQKVVLCNQNDPACRAYSGTKKGFQNMAGTTTSGGSQTCSIERTYLVGTTGQAGFTYTEHYCEPLKVYYANNYSNQEGICYKTPNNRWDINTMFGVRCGSDGKSVRIEGWGSWEGAPCGQRFDYGQALQITHNMSYSGWTNSPRQLIGRLSVNRRMEGENTAPIDIGNVQCISDITPMEVFVTRNCYTGPYYCDYILEVTNLPACNYHLIRVEPPLQEGIKDDCNQYEQSNCRIMNEWWVDANGVRTQTLMNGNPTNNRPTGTTCKPFGTGQMCKEWWKKERTYNCESSARRYDPDLQRSGTVLRSATDNNTGNVSFDRSSMNKENTKECIVKQDFSMTADYSTCESLLGAGAYKCPRDYTYSTTYEKCFKPANEVKRCPVKYIYNTVIDKCVMTRENYDGEKRVQQTSCLVGGVQTDGVVVEDGKCSTTVAYKFEKKLKIIPTGQSSYVNCDNPIIEVDDCGCLSLGSSLPARCIDNYTIGYECSFGQLNQNNDCLAEGSCTKEEYPTAECKYQDPQNKTGLYCDINSIPVAQHEISRRIHRNCIEPEQCKIKCVLQIPDTTVPRGYRTELRVCDRQANNTYLCPNGGQAVLKDCDCILESFDPDEFKPEDCIEKTCIVKGAAGTKSYSLKTCNKTSSNPPQYVCPLGAGESMYQDCGCSDGFALAAGTVGAIVEALNDRECI